MASRKLSYGKMCEELLEQIRSGELAPGGALPSENQLAQKYAICRSSVRTGLLSLEAENLIGRQAGKGWFVRLPQTSFLSSENAISSRLYTLATDLSFMSVPWYHQIIFNGIRKACGSHCVRQVFYDPANLSSLRKGFCDGLICAMSGSYGGMKENPLLSRLPEFGIQPVVVNRFYENPKIGYVSCDYLAEAGRSAAFLQKMGAGRICYIKATEQVPSLKVREQGVLSCFGSEKIDYCYLPSMLSSREYAGVLTDRFREHGIPDVIYLENGSFGSPLFRAFRIMGIKPESVPLVFCFDDISYLEEFYDYPAYYLRMPLEQMMNDAVQYLVKRVDDPSVPVLKKLYRAEIREMQQKYTVKIT